MKSGGTNGYRKMEVFNVGNALLDKYESGLEAYLCRSRPRLLSDRPIQGLLSSEIDGVKTRPPSEQEWRGAVLASTDPIASVFRRRIRGVKERISSLKTIQESLMSAMEIMNSEMDVFEAFRTWIRNPEGDPPEKSRISPILYSMFEEELASVEGEVSVQDEVSIFERVQRKSVNDEKPKRKIAFLKASFEDEIAFIAKFCDPGQIRLSLDLEDRILGEDTLIVYVGLDVLSPLCYPKSELEYLFLSSTLNTLLRSYAMRGAITRWKSLNAMLGLVVSQSEFVNAVNVVSRSREKDVDESVQRLVLRLADATADAMAETGYWSEESASGLVDVVIEKSSLDPVYSDVLRRACDQTKRSVSVEYERAEKMALTLLHSEGLGLQIAFARMKSSSLDLCARNVALGNLDEEEACRSAPMLRSVLEGHGYVSAGSLQGGELAKGLRLGLSNARGGSIPLESVYCLPTTTTSTRASMMIHTIESMINREHLRSCMHRHPR